jgi:hypothetical protein
MRLARQPIVPGAAYRTLRFRRGARRHVGLGHLYRAFGTPLLWRCYRQIFRPRSDLPKFTNRVRRHSEIFVCLNSHLASLASGIVRPLAAFWHRSA